MAYYQIAASFTPHPERNTDTLAQQRFKQCCYFLPNALKKMMMLTNRQDSVAALFLQSWS